MNAVGDLLEKLPYWGDLTETERHEVAEVAHIRQFTKDELIFSKAGGCLGMIFVLEGDVRAYLLSDEGREVTLFRLHEGDPCVLSASCLLSQITFETFMVAQSDCALLVVPIKTFSALMNDNSMVRLFAYEMAAERFSEAMWLMQQVLFMKLDCRLASFLLDESVRTGSCDIQMTQDQIAVCMNSAREVVARMLKRFAEDGLVQIGRGHIVIVDKRALRALL